uniref:Alpha-(1,6)-fucosyltransferase n=1 Tax=Noccaea caerulescens TaxID=107243 RepID=A0A1J3FGJ5_NOCCA
MEAKGNMSMKSLERIVSEKALKLGNSFPCQICVVGFLCGICLTSLFLAALTTLGNFEIAAFSFSSSAFPPCNSTSSQIINMVASIDRKLNWKNKAQTEEDNNDDQVKLLVSAWDNLLQNDEDFFKKLGINKSDVPKAPHLENCEERTRVWERLDTRIANQTYPPWINGGDEENYPLTRRVQRDIWIHQHPLDCDENKNLKFLVADWETLPGFGIGAQIAGMTGLLAIAINENRILVANHYNRADHSGCKGSSRGSWSCYFLPETSKECRKRAFEVMKEREAWESGIVTGKQNYSSKEIWSGHIPKLWGKPWSDMKPTTEINGSLISAHRKMDRRWWRAQAVRYLMRFQTEYTCGLMNAARHSAFGKEAAEIVLSAGGDWRKNKKKKKKIRSEMEEDVWWNHKAWIPRPMLSLHVRMGDKACEMRVAALEEYMRLADRIRERFPELNRIWLSTEMKEVVDRSKSYGQWRFYYTEVARQVGNKSMAEYEASLGREMSTNYPLVNFLMASEADFFVGALGSTWCFLIDGMRNTGGKVLSGYLSVNKDRFW